MRHAHKLIFASTNRHKLEEMKALLTLYSKLELEPVENHIRNASKIGMVENFNTYSENALAKARLANQGCHFPCLADDSGIEIMALEGKPGVRSHRYAIAKAGESQDDANNKKLLTELKGKTGEARAARFVCNLALVIEGISIEAQGVLEGTIAEEPYGKGGFGYDPLFIPKGSTKTLSELGDKEKNKISHRALAMKALFAKLSELGIVIAKP